MRLILEGIISRHYCKTELINIVFTVLRHTEDILVLSKQKQQDKPFFWCIEAQVLNDSPAKYEKEFGSVDSIPNMPKDASRLKAACICVISGLMISCTEEVISRIDSREIFLARNILSLTSMASLHSRCIIFMNNIYISGQFEQLILTKIVPTLSTLMMLNITRFLKRNHKNLPDDPNSEIDRVYRDNLYKEFISCSCEFLANLTANRQAFLPEYNFVDVIMLLFINSEELNQDSILLIVKCLCNFSNLHEYRAKLSTQQMASSLITVLECCWKEDVKSHIFLFIANTCGDGPFCKFLINTGIIGMILEFLTVCKGSYRKYAITALANISYEDFAVNQIVALGGIDIVSTLCYSNLYYIRKQAIRVLYSISQYGKGIYHSKLVNCKTEKALKYFLRKSAEIDECGQTTNIVDMALLILVRLRSHSKAESIPGELNIKDNPLNFKLFDSEGPNEENKRLAEEEKKIGNFFYSKRKWDKAVLRYTEALKYNPNNVVLYCNRSAAYIHLEEYKLALDDANQCIEIDPSWVKGYFRKGKALIHINEYTDAIEVLKKALTIDDNSEIRGAMNFATEQKLQVDQFIENNYSIFNLDEVVQCLEERSIVYTYKLLSRMRQIWESCLKENDLLISNRSNLEDIAHRIYLWVKKLDIDYFIKLEGIEELLFETKLVHEMDYSANNMKSQYDILIVILLSRYIFESFEWRTRSMKRLLALGMNSVVRKHIGNLIAEIFLQKSKEDSLRIPSHKKLFVRLGGLKNLALDFEEYPALKSDIIEFLDSVTVPEWKSRPIDEIDFILEHLFGVIDDTKEKIDTKMYDVFGRIFSLPSVKDLDEGKAFNENDFLKFIQKEVQHNFIENTEEELLSNESEFKKIGYEMGKKWIQTKGIPAIEDDIL